MLAQDTLTGALYEVPDSHLYGWGEYPEVGEIPYDGLGFPIPFLGPLISGAASLLPKLFGGGGAPALPGIPGIPNIGNLIGQIMGGRGGGAPALPGIPGIPNIGNLISQFRGLLGGGQARPRPMPMRFLPAPWPLGWVRPPEGYMPGFHPRRTMMRCTLWPGQQGLIPQAYVNYVPPAAAVPVPPVPVAPGAAPGGFGRRRRHGFRRRR